MSFQAIAHSLVVVAVTGRVLDLRIVADPGEDEVKVPYTGPGHVKVSVPPLIIFSQTHVNLMPLGVLLDEIVMSLAQMRR